MTPPAVGGASPGNAGNAPQRTDNGWLIVMIVVALLVVVVGIAKPMWALRLALICAILAATFITANWLSSLVARTDPERRSIDAEAIDSTQHEGVDVTTVTPLAVAELAQPFAPAGLSQRGFQYLRFVGSERIWERYDLNLAHQPHWPEIQQRVSPELWQALTYQLRPADPTNQDEQLQRLLTEIERI